MSHGLLIAPIEKNRLGPMKISCTFVFLLKLSFPLTTYYLE